MLSFLFGRYPLTMPHTHHINFTLSQCFVDLKLRYFKSTRFCNHRRTSTNYGRLIWDQKDKMFFLSKKDKMLKARGAYQLRLSRGYANHNNCLLPADGSVAVAWTCTIARSKAAAQAARRTSLGRETLEGEPSQTHSKGGRRWVERPRCVGGSMEISTRPIRAQSSPIVSQAP